LNTARQSNPRHYSHAIATAYVPLTSVRPSPLPLKYSKASELFRVHPFEPIPLPLELDWAVRVVCQARHLLTAFRRDVPELHDAFLKGDTAHIRTAIQQIELVSGESCWLVKAKIACLQTTEGLEAQRAYVANISSIIGPTLLHPILHFVGQRNEELVSIQRFQERVDQTLSAWQLPPFLATYLRYELTGLYAASSEELSHVLRVAATGSVVDLYETLIEVITFLAIAGKDRIGDLHSAVIAVLTTLSNNFDDFRINSLIRTLSNLVPARAPSKPEPQAQTTLDHLVRRARSVYTADRNINSDMEAKIISSLSSIVRRSGSAEQATQDLHKFALNHGFLIEAPFLLLAATDTRTVAADSVRRMARAFACCQPVKATDQTLSPSKDTDASILYDLEMSDPRHPLAASLESESLPGSIHAQIERLIEINELKSAQLLISNVNELGDSVDKLQALKHEFLYFAQAGDWWNAAKLAAQTRIEHPGFRWELPMLPLLEGKTWANLRDNDTSPYLTISLYMAVVEQTQTTDSPLSALLRQALRRLLKSQGIASCADFSAESLGVNSKTLLFILQYVCVENNLVGLPGIDTSKLLTQERVKICQRLRELDPSNTPQYDEETRELTYRLELQEGVASFDRSRVFVNLDGIRRWARSTIREDLLRYQSLINANSAALVALQGAIQKLRGTTSLPNELHADLSTESDKLMLDMLLRLRDHYLTNPEDGLDVFLSLRIRHGSLAGNIRGPLEEETLLSLKDETNSSYLPNLYWAERLGVLGTNASVPLDAAFAKFSNSFDSAINHLIRDIIQVRSKEKPEGAFEITVSVPLVNLIKAQISKTSTFDDFLEIVFEFFAASMNGPLKRAKQSLQETLKTTLDEALDTLRIDIAGCASAYVYPIFAASVGRASTNVASAIDRVADWFTPDPLTDATRTYSVRSLVEMGIQITQNTHSGFMPKVIVRVQEDIPPLKMTTGAIVILDVIFTLLDNVFKRSGIATSPNVAITVSMQEQLLDFHVVNEVAEGIRTPEVEERLEKLLEHMQSDSFSRDAASEGGSGLIKLKRIGMKSPSGARTQIAAGFKSDREFDVRVAIPFYTEEIAETEPVQR